MISRFFKKKPKASEAKKTAPVKPKAESRPRQKPMEPQRLLTAEGWKRMMMRRSGKGKK